MKACNVSNDCRLAVACAGFSGRNEVLGICLINNDNSLIALRPNDYFDHIHQVRIYSLCYMWSRASHTGFGKGTYDLANQW